MNNAPPVITSSGSARVEENQTFVLTATAIDDQPNVRFSVTGGSDGHLFKVDDDSGRITFASAPDFENPTDTGSNNTYSLRLTATDTDGRIDIQLIAVTVTDVFENQAPVITSTDRAIALENQTGAITVTATDDRPGVAFSLTGTADADLFSVDADTGVVTFKTAPDFENPADSGTDNLYNFQITATDADGRIDVQNIAITVADVFENTPPAITSADTATIAENQFDVMKVTATDDRPGIRFSLTGKDDAGLFDIDANTGAIAFRSVPNFENPVDSDNNNVYTLQVTATDANGAADTQTIDISITDANDAPVAVDDSITTDEDSAVSGNLFANNRSGRDADADGDTLTIATVNNSAINVDIPIQLGSGQLTVNLDGTFTFDPNGGYDTLVAGENSQESFSYTLDDGNGGTDTAIVTINITGRDEPVIVPTVNSELATIFVDAPTNQVVGTTLQSGALYDGSLVSDTDGTALSDDVILGTAAGDILYGGEDGRDIIAGLAGNDIIGYGSGDAWIEASSGDDVVYAVGVGNSASHNHISLGSGTDSFYAVSGHNRITGTGNNTIGIGSGHDIVTTSSGNDTVYTVGGGGGSNVLNLGEGQNTVWAQRGSYSIVTGAGRDIIGLGNGTDVVDAGNGDNVVYSVNATLTDGRKDVSTGTGDDYIQTGTGDDSLDGGSGLNTLFGGAGADMFAVSGGAYNFVGDFEVGTDKLALEGLALGNLTFYQGTGEVAADAFVFVGLRAIAQIANTTIEDLNQANNFV